MSSRPKLNKPQELDHPVTLHRLQELSFDLENPRYGNRLKQFKNETEVVNEIANKFGLEDVLSSMAVNGFFASEPLIGYRPTKNGRITIKEGNRRLAACIIVTGDSRSTGQRERSTRYQERHEVHGSKQIEPIPVMVFEGPDALRGLLPHLGVKHIVGAQTWDAFAKAYWVAQVIEEGDLLLEDIIQMIGDDGGLSERILSAYYFTEQLVQAGRFDPSDSIRKGRGSQAEFPFSLIYNALDRPQIREWIGMPDGDRAFRKDPVEGKLDNAESLMLFICGSRSREIQPVIKDSRQISSLAKSLANPTSANALQKGRSLDEVEQDALPPRERLLNSLSSAQPYLEDALGVVGRNTLKTREANELLVLGNAVRSLAVNIVEFLIKAAIGDGTKK